MLVLSYVMCLEVIICTLPDIAKSELSHASLIKLASYPVFRTVGKVDACPCPTAIFINNVLPQALDIIWSEYLLVEVMRVIISV